MELILYSGTISLVFALSLLSYILLVLIMYAILKCAKVLGSLPNLTNDFSQISLPTRQITMLKVWNSGMRNLWTVLDCIFAAHVLVSLYDIVVEG
jgi:Fe2+ transport system protein B